MRADNYFRCWSKTSQRLSGVVSMGLRMIGEHLHWLKKAEVEELNLKNILVNLSILFFH